MSRRYFDCPKCGETNPSVAHHRFCLPFGWPFKTSRLGEHLHLVCGRCGYDWTRNVMQP